MEAPALAAVMECRILVNYRVDPDLLGSYLPAPFRPVLLGGHGVVLADRSHPRLGGASRQVHGTSPTSGCVRQWRRAMPRHCRQE
jgi:hypothetical protein